MGYVKINRGKRVFSGVAGTTGHVTGITQQNFLSARDASIAGNNTVENAGIIFANLAFAVNIDFARALEMKGASVSFEISKTLQPPSSDVGLTEVTYIKQLADRRVRALSADTTTEVMATWNGIPVSELMINPDRTAANEGLGTSEAFIDASEESAADLIESALRSREILAGEEASIADGLSQFAPNAPLDENGNVNWDRVTASDLAEMSDEALRALSSYALSSIGASSSSGLTVGRAVYRAAPQTKIFSADMWYGSYGLKGFFGALKDARSQGLDVDMSPEAKSILAEIDQLEADPSMHEIRSMGDLNAKFMLLDDRGVILESYEYSFSPNEYLEDFLSTSLIPPTARLSFNTSPDPEVANTTSINVENLNAVAISYIVQIKIPQICIGDVSSIRSNSVLSSFVVPEQDTIVLDCHKLFIALGSPQEIIPGAIPPGETKDVLAVVSSLLELARQRIIEMDVQDLSVDQQDSLNELTRFLQYSISPIDFMVPIYSVLFIKPSHINHLDIVSKMETSFDVRTFTLVPNSDPSTPGGNGMNPSNDPSGGAAGANGGNGAIEGEGSGPITTPNHGETPFAIQCRQLPNNTVTIQLNCTADNQYMMSNFTRIRVARDVVGDNGMSSYCEGNLVYLRLFQGKTFTNISNALNNILVISDNLQPNVRYRYDIQLADNAFNFSTYQSFLFQRHQPVTYTTMPRVSIMGLQVSQGRVAAATMFEIAGRFTDNDFQLIVDMLQAAGQGDLYTDNIDNQRDMLAALLCYEVVRTNLTTGNSYSFGIYRGPMTRFVDKAETAIDRNIPPMKASDDYVYEVSAFIAKGEQVFASAQRTNVDSETGFSSSVRGTVRNATGDILPNAQQFNAVRDQDSYVPGPAGFWPTTSREYMNVNGKKPTVPTGALIAGVDVVNTRSSSNYRIMVDAPNFQDFCEAGSIKVDIYALYRTRIDPSQTTGPVITNSVFIRSYNLHTRDDTLLIRKSRLWALTPVNLRSFKIKIVAVNSLGQVIDTHTTESMVEIPIVDTLNSTSPIINDTLLAGVSAYFRPNAHDRATGRDR